MLWKRFLLSRATRWATCVALVVATDLTITKPFSVSRATAQEKKKTADELRKELEEKLKGIDLTDPKFDELTKEYEKLIKDAIGQLPQRPIIVGPDQFRNQRRPDGFGLMIPAQDFIREFPNRPPGGRFGIAIEAIPDLLREQLDIPANSGQVVREVTPGSVAEKVGVKVNDIVLEFNGKPVPGDTREFVQMVLDHKAEVETSVVVLRKGKKETIKGIKLPVVKAEAPREPLQPVIQIVRDVDNLILAVPEFADVENSTINIALDQDGVRYELVISTMGKQKELKSIKITDGEKTIEATSIEKVPEKYREQIQRLLKGGK